MLVVRGQRSRDVKMYLVKDEMMNLILDDMPVNDVIALYYEKHDALKQGDMVKLIELKNKCPEIFDKSKDGQIFDMIICAEVFQKSKRYRELQQLIMRDKLTLIKNPSFSE